LWSLWSPEWRLFLYEFYRFQETTIPKSSNDHLSLSESKIPKKGSGIWDTSRNERIVKTKEINLMLLMMAMFINFLFLFPLRVALTQRGCNRGTLYPSWVGGGGRSLMYRRGGLCRLPSPLPHLLTPWGHHLYANPPPPSPHQSPQPLK
jgi:hypothetical protein